jgi:tetratricopeptide (TPR) repeat protein
MSASSSAPTEAARPLHLPVEGLAGDAASPAALGRLTRSLARAGRGPSLKQRRKLVDHMRAVVAALRVRDYQAATERALDALKLEETSGLAWHLLAIAREKSGDLGQAIRAYEAAVRLLPDETDVANDLGRLAQRLGYFEIAEKLFLKRLAQDPGSIEVTNNLACVQRDQGRYGEAIETLRNLLAVEPQSALLWNTLGTVLSDQGEMAGSVVFFDEALRLDPGFSKALYNRANVRMALGSPHDSLRDIDLALSQVDEPVEVDTMLMAKALTQLIAGDLAGGFETYEARFSPLLEGSVRFVSDRPRWDPADDLAGRHLLVFGEQGLGDEVLFANVLPDLIEALGPNGHLTLAVERRLIPLLARSFPTATVVAHRTVRLEGRMTRIAELADDAPPPDAWTPIACLFRRFRRSPDAFPARRSFLTPDPARVAHWRRELAGAGAGPKIGVVWKSLRLDGMRRRYFSPFDLWRPLLSSPGAVFVNLQYGDVSAELEQAKAAGLSLWTPPGIDLKDDLDDVAALACALDLIVGPPNATTNLGAASGADWWAITTPDAWGRFGTDHYPAYPSARIFPIDGFGDWEGVMVRLSDALQPWIADSASRARPGNAA